MNTTKTASSQQNKPEGGEGFVHVSYVSKELGGQVLVVLEIGDDEELDYQFGVACGDITLHEIWAGGINFGPVIDDTSARILAREAAGALALQQQMRVAA